MRVDPGRTGRIGPPGCPSGIGSIVGRVPRRWERRGADPRAGSARRVRGPRRLRGRAPGSGCWRDPVAGHPFPARALIVSRPVGAAARAPLATGEPPGAPAGAGTGFPAPGCDRAALAPASIPVGRRDAAPGAEHRSLRCPKASPAERASTGAGRTTG